MFGWSSCNVNLNVKGRQNSIEILFSLKSIRICCLAVNFPRPRHVLCRTVTSSFRKVPLLLSMTPKREKVGDFKYFNPGERLLKAAILVDVFSATCIMKANDSANIVAIKEHALPITFEARSQCVKCNRNLCRGSRQGHVNTVRNETIFVESLALLIRVAAENIDQNRSS